MAYINVAEWTPDQVTDWLKGLDNSMYKYVNSFANNEIKGQTLLNIRPYELNELGMASIGHQEIVLEAIEQLRNFHYDLEKENLQFLALRVATTAKNLHHQLAKLDKSKIETQILNDITRAIATIKPLVAWLDRSPFQGQLQFNEIRKRILRLGIEMAASAQRDRFVENPVDQIRLTAEKLSKLADYIIQDISDPIILQPATLNLVTLKKRESDLGFNIVPNYHGIHVITDIKYNSPAHISGKIEDGDEIIQINYQTVVGWHYKRVLQQLTESPPDVLLTLKKRPRHTKIYGQIYMKPYRLPSKKRTLPYHMTENLPSPRVDLMPTQNFPMLMPLPEKINLSDSDSSSTNSILIPDVPTKANEKDLRLYLPKPRAVLQRRNTICGDQPSGYRGTIVFWHELNNKADQDSPSLRDKSVSFGFGLEMSSTARPTTCIGIHNVGNSHDKYGDLGNALKGSLPDMKMAKSSSKASAETTNDVNGNSIATNSEPRAIDDAKAKQDVKSKVVKFCAANDVMEHSSVINSNISDVIPYADDDDIDEVTDSLRSRGGEEKENNTTNVSWTSVSSNAKSPIKPKVSANTTGLAEAINVTLIKNQSEKAKENCLNNANDDDKPPEIGPRKEFLKKVAPKPPPRPSKAAELVQRKFDMLKQERAVAVESVEPQSPSIFESPSEKKVGNAKNVSVNEVKNTNSFPMKTNVVASASSPLFQRVFSPKSDENAKSIQASPKVSSPKSIIEEQGEESELLTPNKTKTLTLKKKNSILAKRRKICLKTLEVSDIQGHLFRRTKDKQGVTYWAKLYFVLVETVLYGFRRKNSQKANCLIFLPGFTVSLAKEVHSKSHAYKVYHPKKTFYFAAESEQALQQWMDYIRQATLKGNYANMDPSLVDTVDTRDLYSETDSSEDENDSAAEGVSPPSTFKSSFMNKCSSKKRGSVDEISPTRAPKNEKYHLGFGSLKKFTNLHNLPFTSSSKLEKERDERKKAQSDIPVPTAQFRSYRKVPGNAGMQVGGTSLLPDYNMASQRPMQATPVNQQLITPLLPVAEQATEKPIETASSHKIAQKSETLQQSPSSQNTSQVSNSSLSQSNQFEQHAASKPASKLAKTKTLPFNYMHASNPNLVEFTFQTSKTLDVGLPKVNASNAFDPHQNLQGFITLKDLMLQREEDEAHNMYNNRVNLGVEKTSDRTQQRMKLRRSNETSTIAENRATDEIEGTAQNGQKVVKSKIQSRSLPKTPDYAHSFKSDDSEIIMARTKEGQKLRDFGYEFISGDDMNNGNIAVAHNAVNNNHKMKNHSDENKNDERNNEHFNENSNHVDENAVNSSKDDKNNNNHNDGEHRHELAATNHNSVTINSSSFATNNHGSKPAVLPKPTDRFLLPTKRKGLNWIGLNLDNKRNDNEKLMSKGSFKMVKPKVPETVDANRKDNEQHRPILNRIGREKRDSHSSNQSNENAFSTFQTTHANSRDESNNFPDASRKLSTGSAPTSYLSKLTFPTTKTTKEKRLLGSPRLHRAASSLFGRRNADNPTIDHEIFSPMDSTFNKIPSNECPAPFNSNTFASIDHQNNENNANDTQLSNSAPYVLSDSSIDQNIEYPPVFEPETYSLCDPNASLKLIRRRTFNRNNGNNNSNNK